MTLENTFFVTAHLLPFVLILQALEMLVIARSLRFRTIWSQQNLRAEFARGLPLPTALTDALCSNQALPVLGRLQILMSLAAFVHPAPWIFVGLFGTHLLICLRFRGNFNGGSDTMTFVLLVGMLIVSFAHTESVARLGFAYIAINLLYSYFKAGFSKVIHEDWRTGRGLPAFCARSFYGDVRAIGDRLRRRPRTCLFLSWFVILFEVTAAALPVFPSLAAPYFAAAALFHFLIYLAFGLNRFFWVWLCAWPAVFYFLMLF